MPLHRRGRAARRGRLVAPHQLRSCAAGPSQARPPGEVADGLGGHQRRNVEPYRPVRGPMSALRRSSRQAPSGTMGPNTHLFADGNRGRPTKVRALRPPRREHRRGGRRARGHGGTGAVARPHVGGRRSASQCSRRTAHGPNLVTLGDAQNAGFHRRPPSRAPAAGIGDLSGSDWMAQDQVPLVSAVADWSTTSCGCTTTLLLHCANGSRLRVARGACSGRRAAA